MNSVRDEDYQREHTASPLKFSCSSFPTIRTKCALRGGSDRGHPYLHVESRLFYLRATQRTVPCVATHSGHCNKSHVKRALFPGYKPLFPAVINVNTVNLGCVRTGCKAPNKKK